MLGVLLEGDPCAAVGEMILGARLEDREAIGDREARGDVEGDAERPVSVNGRPGLIPDVRILGTLEVDIFRQWSRQTTATARSLSCSVRAIRDRCSARRGAIKCPLRVLEFP